MSASGRNPTVGGIIGVSRQTPSRIIEMTRKGGVYALWNRVTVGCSCASGTKQAHRDDGAS